MLDRIGHGFGSLLEGELVGDQAGHRIPPPLDEIDGSGEVARAAAARPDQIDLPEREIADAHRSVLAREPDDDYSAGRSHELDGRLHEIGDTCCLEDDLGPVPARPLADGGPEVVCRCDVERVGADCVPVGQAALDPVDEQGGRPAVSRRERQGLTDWACAEDHDVLGRLDATAGHGTHSDRDRLDERREGRA